MKAQKTASIIITLAAVLGLLAGSAALRAFTPSGLLEVHQINVQQGSATLVIGPNGTTVLMDAGSTGKGSEITGYLQSLGLNPADGLDYTIVSHQHSDHLGAMDEVVQAGYDVLVENWYNGSGYSTSAVTEYFNAMAGTTAGNPISAVLGDTIDLGGGALLTVVVVDGDVIGHGTVPGTSNENDRSIAVLVEHGDFDFIWAGDMGGGDDDGACTGRSTSQVNVETPLAQAITPGGGWPLLSADGVDVLYVNHHGSESSMNSDYMNLLKPEVALIGVGAGQSVGWYHPRIDVVENVLLAQAPCITAPAVQYVFQTEEGNPTGATTSYAGYAVGDIKITTDGVSDYQVEATGQVSQGPDERSAAGLPRSFSLDEGGTGNQRPIASFTYSCTDLTCDFTDTSTDSDGTITDWSWNFGDGDTSPLQHPTHTFASAGTYNVTLTVTDDGGLNDGDTQPVAVGSVGPATVILSEVLYDVDDTDDGLEWVELYNAGTAAVDLSGYSLGNGGTDYLYSTAQLSGTIQPGQTFVVGGPTSSGTNGYPSFDLVINFDPDIQNSGSAADGVALFDVPAAQLTGATVPVDAVIYGPVNSNGLIDETGVANAPEVGDASSGSSIERTDLDGNWQIQSSPTPNTTPLPINQAPTVTITAPADGSNHDEGQLIDFAGTASDPEDGDLAANLSWTSDLDGTIGSGGSFSTTLSVGTHLITASVTDSGALEGSDQITVTVDPAGGTAQLVLSEVLYDVDSTDDGLEWVELYNAGEAAVNLSGYSLGNGGTDYLYSTAQLSGTIQPGQTFVVGGPTSSGTNGNPTFDLVINFNPDIQNSGTAADGVALFDVPAAQLTAVTVPIDAVIYGPVNSNGLIDETGVANAPEVGDASPGSSIERTDLAGSWQIQSSPTPNTTPLGSTNQAPTVTITAPGDGSNHDEGQSIDFAGTASDPEDGDLTANLSWTSDLDGTIGSGGSFSTTLSVGTHLITASVTDSGSLEGSDQITVTVNPVLAQLVLSEVLYDVAGDDDKLEWVELYNAGTTAVDLSGYSLGNGGTDYTYSTVQLEGTIQPGDTFVVGGPRKKSANGRPKFDQAINFEPDFQNSGTTADGVALYDVPAAQITSSTVPIDAVVYGSVNSNGLIDETGVANAPEVGDAPSGSSIERIDLQGSWQIQSSFSPGSTPLGG